MKYKLHQTISLLIFSLLVCGQMILAQQGGLDTTFGTNNTGVYQDNLPALNDTVNIARAYGFIEVLADDKIIAAGSATKHSGGGSFHSDFVVRRLNADGSPDNNFGTLGSVQTTFYRWGAGIAQQSDTSIGAMKVQPSDGKIIVAGLCRINGAPGPNDTALGSDLCLVRYNSNGTLDTSFGGNTLIAYGGNPNFPGTSYTMEPGKVFTLTGTNVVNGATTGFGGTPVKIQIATDGRIYVFGNSEDTVNGTLTGRRFKGFVAVYSPSGALQTINSLFDTTGNHTDGWGTIQIYDGDLLSNGDYIAVGIHKTLISSNPAVFSPDRWKVFSGSSGGGFLDSNPAVSGSARAITMTRDNKILVGGGTTNGFGNPMLVRYNGNLTVDTTFGTNGRIVYDGLPNISLRHIARLKTQPDGKILAAGFEGNIARLNSNGSFNRSFAREREDIADSLERRGLLPTGRYATPFPTRGGDDRIGYGGVSFQSNGRIVTAGSTFSGSHAIVIRLKTSFRNGGTFSDFNNDGKSEISVFRSGFWYYLDSFTSAFNGTQFGASSDKPVPADYDGDGRTDIAVYRQSNGVWYFLQSSDNLFRGIAFGTAEDLPRPGDFNGDGQADIAVFRPSNGTWYILYSNPIQPGNVTFAGVQFGQAGDVPLLADFDADGKSDVAVYRAGVWYWLQSTDGVFRAVQFGAADDVPVVGDYDADARADFAVFRPSNGTWYHLNSSTGAFVLIQFGQSGDKPVPGDYDNDGKNDLAVFRNGAWYILQSSNSSLITAQFGLSADLPVPSAYLP